MHSSFVVPMIPSSILCWLQFSHISFIYKENKRHASFALVRKGRHDLNDYSKEWNQAGFVELVGGGRSLFVGHGIIYTCVSGWLCISGNQVRDV